MFLFCTTFPKEIVSAATRNMNVKVTSITSQLWSSCEGRSHWLRPHHLIMASITFTCGEKQEAAEGCFLHLFLAELFSLSEFCFQNRFITSLHEICASDAPEPHFKQVFFLPVRTPDDSGKIFSVFGVSPVDSEPSVVLKAFFFLQLGLKETFSCLGGLLLDLLIWFQPEWIHWISVEQQQTRHVWAGRTESCDRMCAFSNVKSMYRSLWWY